jgi:hypothetical protein
MTATATIIPSTHAATGIRTRSDAAFAGRGGTRSSTVTVAASVKTAVVCPLG